MFAFVTYIISVMKDYKKLLQNGKELLFRQDVHESMTEFRNALELCPIENKGDMGEILFYLGLALQQLGQATYAERCWVNAFLVRSSKPVTCEESWRKFYTVQIKKYIESKRTGRFDTLAEGDMLYDLILMTWESLCCQPVLASLEEDKLLIYYYLVDIPFPDFEVSSAQEQSQGVPVITRFRLH